MLKAISIFKRHVSLTLLMLAMGCGGGSEGGGLRNSKTVEGAADHLVEAFDGSSVQLKKHARSASESMRKGKYRAALISIQEIKLSGEVAHFEEGAAVRDSLVNLEEELIYGMENGDPNAAKTYELLKRVNRN
ncbi:MAG: hypothetical protein HOH33_14085 [Verrucomicrobia bacterium]|jgi:hypothetical protein|nr:hypothetical protein [Verrucomicrobiota bacterium]